jgi:hypothetical protein
MGVGRTKETQTQGDTMIRETSLSIEVVGHRLFELCVNNTFNEMGIKIHGTIIGNRDTTATYSLGCDQKLNKDRKLQVVAFLNGIIACYKSM